MSLLFSALTLGIMIAFMAFMVALIPVQYCSLSPTFASSFQTLIGYLTSWGFFVDYRSLFICISLGIAVETAVLIIQFIGWITRTLSKSP